MTFLSRNNRAMEKKTYKPKNPSTTVRLPPELHTAIREAAARNDRSMNDEIIRRLNAYEHLGSIVEVMQQNAELKQMVQRLIDRGEC